MPIGINEVFKRILVCVMKFTRTYIGTLKLKQEKWERNNYGNMIRKSNDNRNLYINRNRAYIPGTGTEKVAARGTRTGT